MTRRLMTYAPLILLALTLLILYFPLLRGEVFYWGLPTLQFYPWRHLAAELLRDGILPLWNPYNGAGAPLLANYQSALLYPPSWISFVLPLEWTMSLTAVVHLWIAGWGMWRLTGRLGASDLGRGVSMFAFALTNYLVARLFTFPIIEAAAWLPWIAWAALGVLTTGKRRQVVWLALFAALQLLAGHAQTTWYSFALVGLFSVWWTVFTPSDPTPDPSPNSGRGAGDPLDAVADPQAGKIVGTRHASSSRTMQTKWLRLFAVILALALGAGVAAIQLAPTAELLGQSQRGDGVEADFAMNFSYAPARTLNFLSPTIFGTPADGSYFTQGAYFEDAVYIGLIPLISAFAAVVAWLRRRKAGIPVYQTVPFWLIIVVVGFVFALGANTPIFPFLYRNIPTFDMFQAPVRWHLWTVFGLSVLAGIGVSAWGRDFRTRRWAKRALAGGLGALVLLVAGQPFLGIGNEPLGTLGRGLISVPLFITAAALLTLTQPSGESPRYGRWLIAVLVVIAVDLGIASWGLNPTSEQSAWMGSVSEADANIERQYMYLVNESVEKFECLYRFEDYRSDHSPCRFEVDPFTLPNSNLYSIVSMLNNFDPLLVGHFTHFINLIEAHPDQPALLQAAGSDRRAWFVDSVCWHETQADLEAALVEPDWDAYMQIHVLGDAECPEAGLPDDANITVTDHINTVTLSVNAPRMGWLYLADTDYPGWKATLDGESVPIYRANLMFRAVQVDAGLHEVVFSYEPAWAAPALLITVVSLVVLLFLFRLADD
ncbi:MAG: YfhO family protein [Chloroflexi bacterium]|uniref:YfhO family protein n=1 Tax=Candidatus Flexifilum breve TaxID=3140694 RepID=UPI0031362BF4|nr:YfhO family protein [Chloroflexota bacterium]